MPLKYLNIVTIFILTIVAIGIYVSPRYNYDLIIAKQDKVEKMLKSYNNTLELIKQLAPEEKEKFLMSISMVSDSLNALMENYAQVIEYISKINFEVDNMKKQINALEKEEINRKQKIITDYHGSFVETYTDEISLKEDLKKLATQIPPSSLSEDDFESFLKKIEEYKLISMGNLNREMADYIQIAYNNYKNVLNIIDLKQAIYINEKVLEMDKGGKFKELPIDLDKTQFESVDVVGIQHVRSFSEFGVKRIYEFPLDEYPEIMHFNDMRENARDHLIRDVVAKNESH